MIAEQLRVDASGWSAKNSVCVCLGGGGGASSIWLGVQYVMHRICDTPEHQRAEVRQGGYGWAFALLGCLSMSEEGSDKPSLLTFGNAGTGAAHAPTGHTDGGRGTRFPNV